jgi:hypothetical protein
VPLSKIKSEVLCLLAAHPNPESYVGGATPLNRDASRFSADIDVFHAVRSASLKRRSTMPRP